MWTVIDSPLGELRLVAHGDALTGVEFAPLLDAVPTGRPRGPRHDDDPLLQEAVGQLRDYFAGSRTGFELPLAPAGSAFQQQVWALLSGIGFGETASYGQIAARLGRTNAASRAVGLANARNPLPVLIPCHRVIGADGTLTGYAGGLERKRLLLDLEQHALF